MPLEIHNVPANDQGTCRISAHCGETQRGVLSRKSMVHVHEDTKTRNRQRDTKSYERESEPHSVGEIGRDHAERERCGKRRDGV